MSENELPFDRDFLAELQKRAATVGPALLDQLQAAAQDGGVKSQTFKCTSCGRGNRVEVPVMDVDSARRLAELFLAAQRVALQHKVEDDDGSEPILRSIREATDAELAAMIAARERRNRPAAKALGEIVGELDDAALERLLAYARKLPRQGAS